MHAEQNSVASCEPVGAALLFQACEARVRSLAGRAVQALLDEARLTPKPALVDRRGAGAHHDLSLLLMEASALSLRPHLEAMARAAASDAPGTRLRETLGSLGRRAEEAMLQATGGINAHRGAIWAMGLCVAAAAAPGVQDADSLCRYAGKIARLPDGFAPAANSHGQLAKREYGAGGARAEAAAGFPHVCQVGLPALRAARRLGVGESFAQVAALLAIMSTLEDTCLLHRGGRQALLAAQHGAASVRAAGGAWTAEGMAEMRLLEQRLMALWASPGGSADLLAVTLFVDRVFAERCDA
jgi:triphosphoribosyl-dephospho-CoA synthase